MYLEDSLKSDIITKKDIISEAKWYNTVMDWVGIVDPTGTVDLINAYSYYKQGDNFFAILSLLSAIPLADVVSKPVMVAAKTGSRSTRGLRTAVNLIKTNPTKAAKMIQGLSKQGGIVGKFLSSAKTWAPGVASKIAKVPGKGGFSGMMAKIVSFIAANPRKIKSASKISNFFTSPTKSTQIPTKSTQTKFDGEEVVIDSSSNDPLMGMFSKLLGK